MKVAFITRSTLFTVPGGDTIQITETAQHLTVAGIEVDIKLTCEKIIYNQYSLLHFFNITRPADILYHIHRAKKPFVVSTIFIDYSEYDQAYRSGLSGFIFKFFPVTTIEYLKAIAKWVLGKDKLISKSYLWKGQRNSIKEILLKASALLPNSLSEYNRLEKQFGQQASYFIIPNGINSSIFQPNQQIKKDPLLVICVARIEGIKNQLNLIKALNHTKYKLLIIGNAAPNQISYYNACKKIAAKNVVFIDNIPQRELLQYYQKASIHVLPSWFETTGLSSLEAAAMDCKIVITAKGDTKEYFEEDVFYCDPSSPESILNAIEEATIKPYTTNLREKIFSKYTWRQATIKTLNAYSQVINLYEPTHWNFRHTWNPQSLWRI